MALWVSLSCLYSLCHIRPIKALKQSFSHETAPTSPLMN